MQVREKDRRREYIERLIEGIEERVSWVAQRFIEESLAAEVDGLLKRGWYERRRPKRRRQSGGRCKECGSQDAGDFRRNGHYRRYLDTKWGRLQINMPQIKCKCEGWVQVPFKTLRSRQRVWDDLEGEIRERYGWGMSLRWIKECVDARLSSSVSLRTQSVRGRDGAAGAAVAGTASGGGAASGTGGRDLGNIDARHRQGENGSHRSPADS